MTLDVTPKEFLITLLQVRSRPPAEVNRLSKKYGFSWRAIRRAKELVEVRSIRVGFPSMVVAWALTEVPTARERARAEVLLMMWEYYLLIDSGAPDIDRVRQLLLVEQFMKDKGSKI